jgi:hypothetical protein
MNAENRNVHRYLGGKNLEKRSLGRWSKRREDNINIDLRQRGCEKGRWINWLKVMCNGGLSY